MSTPEQQLNTESNLQTLETEVALTKVEIEEFGKLPKEEQEKQKDEKLAKLKNLNEKLDQAIQEAIQTGQIEEAKRLQEILINGIGDLEEFTNYTERSELLEGAKTMEIITDPEINSAETAISKLEAEGYKMNVFAEDLLINVNWQEKLESSYEVVSFSVGELFGDTKRHTYSEIKQKAKKLNFDLVPQALVPQIRLNYEKNSERTIIATEAMRDSDDVKHRLFYCDRGGAESWFCYTGGYDDFMWNPVERFFFVASKNLFTQNLAQIKKNR